MLYVNPFFRCDMCKENGTYHCYHWHVGNENSIARFQETLEVLLEEYFHIHGSHYDEVKQRSKVVYDPNDLNRYTDKLNIHFDPAQSKFFMHYFILSFSNVLF